MLSLNIQMHSFELNDRTIKYHDKIRVSITTFPGGQKQSNVFDAKKIQSARPFFSVRINEKTEKILIVIRKKSFAGNDPIIASTVIQNGQFPTKFEDSNTEVKTIELLEPVHRDKKITKTKDRKIKGQVCAVFTLSKDLPIRNNNKKFSFSKKRDSKGFSKVECLFDNEDESELANLWEDDPIY
ncbi:hypothetical protein M9Y10_030400 [Tritrichomonas musculus]|uniref:Uncharacterized protein n=1 Tax=Tritrichomonas musculus TaxID=1915356 RepID=A0ABR2H4E9_9EUKA